VSARRSTGLAAIDAQHDFLRVRRAAIAARLLARLRGSLAAATRPGAAAAAQTPIADSELLRYDEVVHQLGFASEQRLGMQVVPLDAIVGTLDRGCQFDRRFRPLTARLRSRWEQIAAAMRRGEPLPPIDLVQIDGGYFVRDGHHRVSVARALGYKDIDAIVTEVLTERRPCASLA